MAQFLAIVAYRSLISGLPRRELDLQVQWFDVADEVAVRQLIEAVPITTYKNRDDETVSWELVQIFAIEPFSPSQSGEEVVGFIASIDELRDLA
ncbi:MAG: hypothetical protein U0941_29300 [Planctomycetaceae bacterium]